MPDRAEPSSPLLDAAALASTLEPHTASSGIRYSIFGDTGLHTPELLRVLGAVPATVAPALAARIFVFVPLALASGDKTEIAPAHTPELADQAICHRDVPMAENHLAVFISARLLRDHFALAFEFFINAAHAFADISGTPSAFADLVWSQALADVRGETSHDAFDYRAEALPRGATAEKAPNEARKTDYLAAAFADALAIYMLSLSLDFDYAELREREYPLLAPAALAARLRLISTLFPAPDTYEFAIRYRRR